MAYGRSIPCDLTRESWSDRARQRPTLSTRQRAKSRGQRSPVWMQKGPAISDQPFSRGARIWRRGASRRDTEHASACEEPGTEVPGLDAERAGHL